MEDAFIAFDTIGAFLLAGGLAMVVFSHRELRVARLLLTLCALVISVRWVMWAMVIQHPWWVRAVAGGVLGAAILGGLPAIWQWSRDRESPPVQTTTPAVSSISETSALAGLAELGWSLQHQPNGIQFVVSGPGPLPSM